MILTIIKIIKKEHTKIKSLIIYLLLFSLIILITFHTIFASFYFALFQYFHDINWNTLNLEMVVWSGDLPSLLMAIIIIIIIIFIIIIIIIVIMTSWLSRYLCCRGKRHKLCKNIVYNTLKKHMFWIFVRIASVRQFKQISKTYIFWGDKNKTRPFLHINLLIK